MLFKNFYYKNSKLVRVFILIILVVVVFAPLNVSAWTGFYFNGAWKTINNNGAALTIETQNPSISVDSSVSVWAMTCDEIGSYAQVGWLKFSGYSSSKYFYEYNYEPNGVWYQKELGTATAGSNNDFMVGCDSTTMYFKINNISYGTVSLATIPFSRSMVQFFGETHDANDQCPGSVSNPVTMGNAQYKNTSNSWVSATSYNPSTLGYGDLTTMRNNVSSSGSTSWEIWDSRY